MKFLLRYVCALFLVLVSSTVGFAASAERFVPRRSVRAEFSRDKGVLLSDIRLVHKDKSFTLIIGNEKIALRKCFVAQLVRDVDWDVVARYTQAGGKLLVKRLAPGEFEIRLAGGLDGGFVVALGTFLGVNWSIEIAIPAIIAGVAWLSGGRDAVDNIPPLLMEGAEVFDRAERSGGGSSSSGPEELRAPSAPGTDELEKEGRADAVQGPSQSDFLGAQKKVKGRRRWHNGESGNKKRIYEWDDQHKHVEEYNRRRKHTGVRSPTSGRKLRDGVPGRTMKD